MPSRFFSVLLSITAALLLAGCAGRPAATPARLDSTMQARIEAELARTMKEDNIPGLAIGIIQHGQVVYSRGFGVAEIGTSRTVTPQTVFQLGSDSKMFVGIAMMQLQAQGKINIDDPLVKYLPYFRLDDARYKTITLRQILSHQSGMPYCINWEDCDVRDYQTPQYDDGALERHVRKAAGVKLDNPPGKIMQYSDLGFEMLGDVIAKVSGQSFESYVQQHILTPLGMKHSSFLPWEIPASMMAIPHIAEPEIKVNGYFPYSRQHAPSSHLFSNVEDMNRFARVQLQRGRYRLWSRLVPPAAYEQMWAPQIDTTLPSPWEKQLGLGWFIGNKGHHRLVGHAGGDTGFACSVIMAPDDGVAVVLMSNMLFSAEDTVYPIISWLLDAEDAEKSARSLPR